MWAQSCQPPWATKSSFSWFSQSAKPSLATLEQPLASLAQSTVIQTPLSRSHSESSSVGLGDMAKISNIDISEEISLDIATISWGWLLVLSLNIYCNLEMCCSVVVKLLDLHPQGRWFDPWCGHKICTAVGPLSKDLNPTLLQGKCLLHSLSILAPCNFPPFFLKDHLLLRNILQPPCMYCMLEISPQIFNNIQVWELTFLEELYG